MNKVYRVIWNESLGAWVAVSEITKSKGKKSNKAIKSGVLVSSLVLFAGNAIAASYVGGNATATGSESVAIGEGAKSPGDRSVALGTDSFAQKKYAAALGESAKALGDDSAAVGTRAEARADYSTALGNQSIAEKKWDLAAGYEAKASGGSSTAVGFRSQSTGDSSNAIGGSSLAAGQYSTAVGQESKAIANFTLAAGYKANASGEQSTAVGFGSQSTGKASNAIGGSSLAAGEYSTAVGQEAHAEGDHSIALGLQSKTAAGAQFATALGYKANASGRSSFAQGALAEASGGGSIAIGDSSKATTNDTIAIGVSSEANLKNSVALGINSKTSTNAVTVQSATVGGITYGGFTGAVSSVGHQISVGDTGNERQIKHVAAGAISDKSTDAINGSQLYATNEVLGNVANSTKNILGGNATLNPNGTLTMTNIGNTGKNTIHDAIAASQEEVVAGTNIASVVKTTDATGKDTFTVNAKGTTASAGSTAVTVVAGTPDANNVTDYVVDLSKATKDSLVNADNALQTVVTQIDGTTVKTITKSNNTANFLTGKNIKLTPAAGGIEIATADNVAFTNVNTTNLNTTGVTNLGGTTNITGDAYYTGPITNGNNIVNKTYVDNSVTTLADTPLTFAGDTGANVERKLGETVNVVGGNKGALTDGNIGVVADGSDTLTVKLASDLAGLNSVSIVGGPTINGNGINMGGDKITNLAKGDVSSTSTDAVNGSQLYAVSEVANKGWNFTATNGSATSASDTVKPGETLDFANTDGNIGITSGDNKLTFNLAKDIKVDSVTAGGTVVKNDGITIVGGPSITTNGINAGGKAITNVAPGVNDTDAVNVNQLKAAKSTVEGDKGVSVTPTTNADGSKIYTVAAKTDGTTTTINADGKIAAVTTTFKPSTDGKVGAPVGNGDSLVTANTVADAINNSGWKATSGATGSGVVNGTTEELINPSETVKFQAGDNMVLNQAGNVFTYSLNKDININSVQIGANGPTIKADASNNIKIAKSDGSATKITNVAAGTADTDAVNLSQLNQVAANQKTSSVKAGTNIASVDATTSGNNTEYTVNAKGTTVTQGDGIDLTTTDAGSNTTNYKVGLNQATKDSLAKADSALQTISSSNPNVVVSAKAASGNQTVGFLDNPTFAGTVTAPTFVTSGANPVTMGNGTVSGLTNTTFDPKATYTGGQAATQEQLSSASSQLNNTLTAKGMDYMGDSGTVVHRDLGTQVNVKGGATGTLTSGNIGVVADGTDTLNVQLAKDINLGTDGSLTTGNTKVNNTGVTISNGTKGQPVSLTASGLNNGGNTITNVAAGTADTDAVNVSQLKAAKSTVEGNKGVSVTSKTNNDGSTTYTVAAKTDGTTVKVDDKGNIAAVTAPLTTNTDGKVDTPAAPNALATAGDIANAINNSGWKLAADGTTGTELINPSDTVTFKTGSSNLTVKREGANITYDLAKNININSVKFGDNGPTIKADASNDINIAKSDGSPTKITNVKAGTATTDAVNVSQLKNQETTLSNKGLNFSANSGPSVHKNLGDSLGVIGTGTKADSEYSGENVKTITDANGNIVVQLDKNLTADSVTTNTVTLNGKPGTPGISITGAQGPAGVNGQPGETTTRIKYNDGTGPQQIANLNDGLKFAGNQGSTINKKLNETLSIKGGLANADAATATNLRVDEENGELKVKLARNLKDLDSVTVGNNVLDGNGLTVGGPTGPSITTNGINAGGKAITNVNPGVNGTDAVNVDQLKAAKSTVKGDKGVSVTPTTNADGTTYTVAAKTDNTTVKVDNNGNIAAVTAPLTTNTDGKVNTPAAPNALVTANTVANAINNSGWKLAADGTTGTELINPSDTVTFKTGSSNLTVKRDGANITYDLAKDININSVKFGDNGPTIKADASNNINIAKSNGSPTKITNVEAGTDDNDAVNVSQLKAQETTLGNKGLNFSANSGPSVHKNLGDTLGVIGTGTKADSEYSGNNIKTITDANGNIVVQLDKNLTTDSVTTNTVTLNGKPGVSGQPGTPGISITGAQGPAGVNGKPGEVTTRIEYNDGTGPQQVANLNDGLKFAGNQGSTINKKLNETLSIKGGLANADAATATNLRVDEESGELKVKLARNLKDLDSVTVGNNVLDGNGLTVGGPTGPSITTNGINAGGKAITNVAPGVNGTDAVNVNQLKAAKSTVEGDKGVSVTPKTNADGTTYTVAAKTDNTTVKVDDKGNIAAVTTTFKPSTDGKVGAPVGNGDSLVTANTVADAINNSGWKATSGATGSGVVNGTTEELINPSETVKFQAGDNMVLNQAGNVFTYSLNKDININSVKFGGNGPTIKADASNNINIAKSDGSATNITNVKAGEADTDAVNVSQLKDAQAAATTKVKGDKGVSVTPKTNADGSKTYTVAAKTDNTTVKVDDKGNIAAVTTGLTNTGTGTVATPTAPNALATAGDIANAINNAGFNLQANGDTKSLVKTGDTVQFLDGDNIKITRAGNDITVATAKNVTFDSVTAGPVVINSTGINAGNTQIKGVKAGTAGTDAVNVNQLKAVEATANKGWNLTTNGKTASKSNVKPGDTVDFANTDGNVKIENTGNNVIVNLNKDINLTDAGSVTIGDTKLNNNSLTVGGANKVTVDGKTGIIKGLTNTTWDPNATYTGGQAATQEQLKSAGDQLTTKGLNFAGNQGANIHKNLGDTLLVKGSLDNTADASSKNLRVDEENGELKIKLARNLTDLDSVTVGNTVLNPNGLTVGGPTGPSITTNGINAGGKAITNVNPGVNGTDAVNVNQLKAVEATANKGWNLTTNGKTASKSNVKPGDTVDFANTDGNVKIENTGNNVIVNLNKDIGLTKDGSVTIGDTKLNNNSLTVGGTHKVTVDGETGTIKGLTNTTWNPNATYTGGQAATQEQLKSAGNQLTTKGLNFNGNQGANIHKNLGDTLLVKGSLDNKADASAKNVRVDSENGELIVKVSENPVFTTVQAGKDGDRSVLSNDGLTITNVGKPTVSLTENGLDNGNNQIVNVASGLTKNGNKVELKDAEGNTLTNAVNVGDLKEAANNLVATGFKIDADKRGNGLTDADTVELGQTVKYTGKDGNIVTTVTDNAIDFALNSTLSVGKAGEPGKVGIKGANGKDAISLNGKDGTIGINGKDGANATLTVEKAKPALDGKDGQNGENDQTRIVYTKPNGSKEEVATLNDGLNFKADDGSIVAKKLNETLEIVGGADKDKLTDNNIGVNNKNGKLTVQLAKDININSVKFGENGPTIKADANNNINIAKSDGSATKITNVEAGTGDKDAVNVSQLKNQETTLSNKGLDFVANSGAKVHKNLGDTLGVIGTGTKADSAYSGDNIKTITDANGNIVVQLDKNLTTDSVTTNTVTLNGKPGVNGQPGTPGISITGAQGPAGVNGQPGGTTTRIVYNDGTGPQQIANLNDGLKFAGNQGSTINKKLNETLSIKGGLANADAATATNLRVDEENGELKIKLARNLTDLDSVTVGNTVLNPNGLTVGGPTGPSITTNGINAGGKAITNVAPGVNGTDAVNVNQLEKAANNLVTTGFNIADGKGGKDNVKLGETVTFTDPAGNIITTVTDNKVEFGLNSTLSVGKDGEPGKVGIKGADGKDAISLNGKDGTIGLKGADGKDGISLNGKDGTIGINGKNGANATLTVEKAKPALDGKDGQNGEDGQTRIVYTKPNGSKEEVATLNDGLNFKADDGSIVAKKLNETLEIVGGADKDKLTDNNIGVNNKDGKLTVQLAKDININSVKFGDNGPTIKADASNNINIAKSDGSATKITNVEAGTGATDAVNVSQLKAAQSAATTKVKEADGIKVDPTQNADGSTTYTVSAKTDGTTTKIDDKGNIAAVTTTFTPSTDGKVGAPVGNGDSLVTANTVADAINNSGWKATSGATGSGVVNGTTEELINPSETVKFQAGDNMVLNQAGNVFTYSLNKDININSVQIGANGPTIKADANNNINIAKSDGSATKITNVAAGTGDNDAVNVSQLKAVEATANKGWNLTTNGKPESKSNVKPGDTVDFANEDGNVKIENKGNNVIVNLNKDIDLTKDGSVTIGDTKVNNDGLTIAGGPSVTKSGIDAGDKKITNVAPGKISADSKDAINGSQLYTVQQAAVAAKTEVKAGDNVEVKKESGGNGQDIYTVSAKDTSASVTAGSDAITVNKADPKKVVTVDVTDYKVDLSQATKDNIQKGVDAKGIVDNKGLTFAGDNNSSTEVQKLGSTVNVKGDKNITTQASGNTVKVTLNPNVTVESLTATNSVNVGSGNAQVALTTNVGKDDVRELSVGSANAPTRITNVARGVNNTDAVNLSQLKDLGYNINTKIDKVEKEANAGIASAMAMETAPFIAGKWTYAVGAAYHGGEQAVGATLRKTADNGRWSLTGGVATGTEGDTSVRIGISGVID